MPPKCPRSTTCLTSWVLVLLSLRESGLRGGTATEAELALAGKNSRIEPVGPSLRLGVPGLLSRHVLKRLVLPLLSGPHL
ncbi:hypothetical protein BKA59DRAFT_478868 [Fusarium tricinctum]|uniref:Secreted protein n=1 Tax=Fusarium tricinctum TaxID=61284 RepID=A0A8K0RTJ1_9HYPO|nr:hypothetical protein BKA59DRAFT_478868 [Fusarium tricinctum]